MSALICPQCCQWTTTDTANCPACGYSISTYLQGYNPQQINQHQQQLQQYVMQQQTQGAFAHQSSNSEKYNLDSAVPSFLINCPDCGERISVLSQSCPMCGRINPASSPDKQFIAAYIEQDRSSASQWCFVLGILAFIGSIFVGTAIGSSGSSPSSLIVMGILLIISTILVLISFYLPSRYFYKTTSKNQSRPFG